MRTGKTWIFSTKRVSFENPVIYVYLFGVHFWLHNLFRDYYCEKKYEISFLGCPLASGENTCLGYILEILTHACLQYHT